LGSGFGFGFRLYKDLTLIQVYRPCHLTNPTNWILLVAK